MTLTGKEVVERQGEYVITRVPPFTSLVGDYPTYQVESRSGVILSGRSSVEDAREDLGAMVRHGGVSTPGFARYWHEKAARGAPARREESFALILNNPKAYDLQWHDDQFAITRSKSGEYLVHARDVDAIITTASTMQGARAGIRKFEETGEFTYEGEVVQP